jgi:hypothetical protein
MKRARKGATMPDVLLAIFALAPRCRGLRYRIEALEKWKGEET